MLLEIERTLLDACDASIRDSVARARKLLVGLEANLHTITAGKLNGRLGIITDVSASGAGLAVRVDVYRKDGSKRFIKSGCYYDLDDVRLTNRRVGGV